MASDEKPQFPKKPTPPPLRRPAGAERPAGAPPRPAAQARSGQTMQMAGVQGGSASAGRPGQKTLAGGMQGHTRAQPQKTLLGGLGPIGPSLRADLEQARTPNSADAVAGAEREANALSQAADLSMQRTNLAFAEEAPSSQDPLNQSGTSLKIDESGVQQRASQAARKAATQKTDEASGERPRRAAASNSEAGAARVSAGAKPASAAPAARTSSPPPAVDTEKFSMGQTAVLAQTQVGQTGDHGRVLEQGEPKQAAQLPTQVQSAEATQPEAPQPTRAGGRVGPESKRHKKLTQIGQYEIIRQLGEGGMGVVYLARDTRLGRRVAIKVLRTQDPDLTRRFIIEARTTARCTHENIVIIHDAGEYDASPYMVLEYLEGKDLTDYKAAEPPSVTHSVEILVSVVRALVRAHEQGIVHRDLKPDNIFITESGTVKVLDFGIAKLLGAGATPELNQSTMAHGSNAHASIMPALPMKSSDTGIAGTAGYMAPEQWLTPDDVDHRADIWAVGCTLFELVTGQNPLVHLGDPVSVARFLAGPKPMPTALSYGAKIPRGLNEIIEVCLKKDREERYPDARTLLKALEPFLPGRAQSLDGEVELGPFAGLRAFQEEDAGRFFGRSRELGTLLSRLRETPLMGTVGPSGVGKSSFLRAGVIPALKNSGTPWKVLVCRPGRNPLLALAECLRPVVEELPKEAGGSGGQPVSEAKLAEKLGRETGYLGALLRGVSRFSRSKIMLFLDQFEELYTLGAEVGERRAFTTALLGAADDAASPLRVMLSIRADFVGRTTEDPDFVSVLSKGLFFLGPPSEEGLREALVRPAEMMGYRFESAQIIDEMLTFLKGTPGGLPLLQFTAAQLWEARDPQNRMLTLSSYRGMGGVEGALVSHADRVYNHLPPDLQVLCRTLFMHLVTNEGTRAIRTMRELEAIAGDEKAAKRLVNELVESRLWVTTAEGADATVEIVHESLIGNWPSLKRWLDESHDDSVFIDQLMGAATAWQNKKRDTGLLWRGELVRELEHFERHYKGKLPPLAEEFSKAVRLQATRTARRRRLAVVGSIGLLVALFISASVGLVVVNEQKKNARASAVQAERSLAEQIRAEKRREAAEVERQKAEAENTELEVTVSNKEEELERKNQALLQALQDANEQSEEARRAQRAAEQSSQAAKAAKQRAQEAALKLQKLLERERARAERLEARIGTIVEELK